MLDDKDREVCARLEKDILSGINHHSGDIYKAGDEWTVVKRVFNDPGMKLHLCIHEGTALEGKATVTIEYWHR